MKNRSVFYVRRDEVYDCCSCGHIISLPVWKLRYVRSHRDFCPRRASTSKMTSLAVQLAQNASLNKALLVDRSRRKPRESYLFTGKEADNHDLDSLHALGINGLIQLSSLNPQLRTFEDSLFSDQARSTDRTLLSTELNEQLNKNIAAFLPLLGPYLLESPSNKVLEWLVRRFRCVCVLG